MEHTPLDWRDAYYRRPSEVAGQVVRVRVDAPLFQIAHLHRSGVRNVDFSGKVTSAHARTLWEEIGAWDETSPPAAHPVTDARMLANACTAGGFRSAVREGASGAGLVRGEFLFAVVVSSLLGERLADGTTVLESLCDEGDFATLAQILRTPPLRSRLAQGFTSALDAAGAAFPSGALVFVRAFDFGDAYTAHGGPRGIGLLLERLPEAIVFLAEIVAAVQDRHDVRFVFAPPMVTSYAELTSAVSLMEEAGTPFATAAGDGPGFGWEIETPAAALCTGLWADHLLREHELAPAACGIGTNDLTQFTLARSRRSDHPGPGRHEAHPAVLALLARLAADCADRGLTAVLSGAAAEDASYRHFAHSLGLLVSCTPYALQRAGDATALPILDQAVTADALRDAGGLHNIIVWRRRPPRPASTTSAQAEAAGGL